MIELYPPQRFLVAGVGPSASSLLSRLQSRNIANLPCAIVHSPGLIKGKALDSDVQLRTLQWLLNEIPNLDVLFLVVDFSDDHTFELYSEVAHKAAKDGVFVLVFPIGERGRIKSDYHIAINERFFIVDQIGDHFVANGIKSLLDIAFGPQPFVVDYWDILGILRKSPGRVHLGQGEGGSYKRAFEKAVARFKQQGVDLEKAISVIVGIAVGQQPNFPQIASGLEVVQLAAWEDAEITFGMSDDPTLGAEVRVSIFAFGYDLRF